MANTNISELIYCMQDDGLMGSYIGSIKAIEVRVMEVMWFELEALDALPEHLEGFIEDDIKEEFNDLRQG